MIKYDLEKVKEIHKNMIRKEREPLLKALDLEVIKALEANDTKRLEEIKNEKQALRDVTKYDLSLTQESVKELKNLKLEHLLKSK